MTPAAVWREYGHGQDYKHRIGLYEQVRRNEDFFLGRQWEGLRVKSLDPLIFNVLRRCVNLFVSMLVSDDVAVEARPFDGDERTARVLGKAFEGAIERSRVKVLGRQLLRNACVDGDGCYYIHFDPHMESGQAVRGDIAVELIDNTDIYFGNPACDEVQRQPYLILAMRRQVEDVKCEALRRKRPAEDINAIVPDGEGAGQDEADGDGRRCTVLLRMWKAADGMHFLKTTRGAVVMPETVLPYRLYPVAYMSWNRVKNSCHGVSPVTEAIPNQVAINKLYSMYVQCVKQVAFPKIIYDMTRFPDGYSNDVGKAVGMRGNPNEAVLAAFRAPDISGQVMGVLKQMMRDTMELMGASDAALGNVAPTNTSAIVAVQKATAAPMELTRMEFYRFIEDWARIFLDLMGAHYGVRSYVLTDGDGAEVRTEFDFSTIAGRDMMLNVDVGAASYWSETMQTVTNDHLLESGVITDPLLYLENIPDSQVRGKRGLLRALRGQKNSNTEKEKAYDGNTGTNL